MFHKRYFSKDVGTVIDKLLPEEVSIGNVKDRGRMLFVLYIYGSIDKEVQVLLKQMSQLMAKTLEETVYHMRA